MFAAPRPILPGETSAEAEAKTKEAAKEPVLVSPAVPEHETAWERGMRQVTANQSSIWDLLTNQRSVKMSKMTNDRLRR